MERPNCRSRVNEESGAKGGRWRLIEEAIKPDMKEIMVHSLQILATAE